MISEYMTLEIFETCKSGKGRKTGKLTLKK